MRARLAAVLIALPFAASADETGIQIEHAWSRPTVGREGVIYLTITDTGGPDTLVGITTPVAAMAELHQSFDDHGVMKMRPVAALPIEPRKPITLAPGGYHIMLAGLKQPLQQGDRFTVTLRFATAGPVTATVTVEKAGTPPMGSMPMQSNGKRP
jgi:copper(I)-binding protein